MSPKTNTPLPTGSSLVTSDSSTRHGVGPTFLEATVETPDGQTLTFGTLSLISISSHREKFPVTSLSSVGPKGFTFGHRLIAGTLAFSVFERSAFQSLLQAYESPPAYVDSGGSVRGGAKKPFYEMPVDAFPEFNVHMVYVTDAGITCYEGLRGVTILDEGAVRSVDTLRIHEAYSFMARQKIPLQRISTPKPPVSQPYTPPSPNVLNAYPTTVFTGQLDYELDPFDTVRGQPYQSYPIQGRAGQSVQLTDATTGFSGWLILRNLAGTIVAQGPAPLQYTFPDSGTYTVEMTI